MEQPVLLKSVLVQDPQGPWHNQVVDILIQGGMVKDIGTTLSDDNALVLQREGSTVSMGWVDGQAHFREPGEETKEGLLQGLHAASQGGYTAVGVLPSTNPCVDHASAVRNVNAVAAEAHRHGVPSIPLALACLSEGRNGLQLAEMHDLSEAGAAAFTDDAPIEKASMLQRALTYSQMHGKTVADVPLEQHFNAGGMMHEGKVSTEMGLTGIPHEAETLRVTRDLDMLKYAGGRLHLSPITCATSVDLIRQAKQDGLQVTCATTAAHLMYSEEDMKGFNGTLRVRSPFRTSEDREALRHGVLDGTIDAVVSDHRPEDLEHHDVEFMLSPEGIASLPSSFGLALSGLLDTASNASDAIEAVVRAFTEGPRHVLSMEQGHVDAGTPCDLTWFHPGLTHVAHNASKGVNLPPLPDSLKGQVLGVFKEDRHWTAD